MSLQSHSQLQEVAQISNGLRESSAELVLLQVAAIKRNPQNTIDMEHNRIGYTTKKREKGTYRLREGSHRALWHPFCRLKNRLWSGSEGVPIALEGGAHKEGEATYRFFRRINRP